MILSAAAHLVCSGPLADFLNSSCSRCGNPNKSAVYYRESLSRSDCNAELYCIHLRPQGTCIGHKRWYEFICETCDTLHRVEDGCDKASQSTDYYANCFTVVHRKAQCSCPAQ